MKQGSLMVMGCGMWLLLAGLPAGGAEFQDGDRREDRQFSGGEIENGGRPGERGFRRNWPADATVSQPRVIESGFVFMGDQYVPGPYLLQQTEEGLRINDRLVESELPQPSYQREDGGEDWGGRSRDWGSYGPGGYGFSRGGRSWSMLSVVAARLQSGAAIVILPGEPIASFKDPFSVDDLFQSFLSSDVHADHFQDMLGALPPEADVERWIAWATGFQPPAELRRLIEERVAARQEIERENAEKIASVKRFDSAAYPLTMLGMIVGVLALGHLLHSLPKGDHEIPAERRAEASKAVMYSVGLIAFLSALDLTWTILASQAGMMKELNPIGSRFIHDPQLLTLFKAGATLLGCGLLYVLRQHSRARWASWWLCLVCTVLTFRWLMFNSMFIA